MPVICWGPLAKSAQDPTTIAEYIEAKILNHNIDTTSHGLDGYALYNHRDSYPADHLDYSITTLKLTSDWIVSKKFETSEGVGPGTAGVRFTPDGIMMYQSGKRKVNIPVSGDPTFSGDLHVGSLFFDKFVLMSFFESIDGFFQDIDVGEINVNIGGIDMITGGANNDYVNIAAQPAGGNRLNFAKNPLFQTDVKIESITTQNIWITVGEGASAFGKYFGFKIINGTLYAVNRNASTETATVINGITLTNWNTLKAVMDSGTNIKFYVNNVLVATHTTNLPTTTTDFINYWYLIATAASTRTMWVANMLFVQDPE